MNKFTLLDIDEMEPMKAGPRDSHGQFIPRDCPICQNGKLTYERGVWRCDGLIDPEDDNKPLAACENVHFDGDPKPTNAADKSA